MSTYELRRGVIRRAYAEDVYPDIEDGSVRLIISDGPYFLGKAAWDKGKLDDLPTWYAPHIEAWGRVCMPSASVYLWNTAEGWARLDPVMRAAGWTHRALITWNKGLGFLAGKCDVEGCRTWPDVTEVCGFYQRNEWEIGTCAATEIAHAAGRDDKNWIRPWLVEEWKAAGLKSKQADRALGTNGMAGHYFGASQWSLPTWENYRTLAEHAAKHGPARERPYLVHPAVWPGGDLRASYDHLRAEYDHLRAEYERARVPFTLPPGITNVWTHPQVGGVERLRGPDGKALHPCQKPLTFSDRMIRASSKPEELVLEPFGGTCRVAVACERMPEPEARRYVCIEPDEDGRDYIAAVLPSLRLEFEPEAQDGQRSLFACPAAGDHV